jgi:MFS transporter, DHA1 family, multidrug resistance protein
MVGIQFVMTAGINFLSPIIPLMLPQLGVGSAKGIDIWSGVITGSTSFVAAFASPVWGRVADRNGRKLSLLRSSFAIALFTGLMGLSTNVWQFFGARAVMGAFAGFSSAAIALVASQVPERRLGYALGWLASGQMVAGRPSHRRSAGRSHRQLSCPVFLVCRHYLRRPGPGLGRGDREFHPGGINR